MSRPAMNPQKKKQAISLTLTPEQLQALRSMAADAEESTSATIGRLITAEVKRLDKRVGKQQPQAATWSPTGRTTTASVRDMIKGKGTKEDT